LYLKHAKCVKRKQLKYTSISGWTLASSSGFRHDHHPVSLPVYVYKARLVVGREPGLMWVYGWDRLNIKSYQTLHNGDEVGLWNVGI
jgi:hypothetical protein